MTTKRKPERIPMRFVEAVVDGARRRVLVAADQMAAARLKARKFNKHDLVFAELRQPRNPKFHRFVHAFAIAIAENVEAFEGLDPHTVIKRIQLEGSIGCDELFIQAHGQTFPYRIPRSLSFESMDEGEFQEVYGQLREYVIRTYWPGCTEYQIEQMAQFIEDRAA